ncbi:MAG TPA: cyclodeaminase/cyclohydrolase family protein, partial [Chitinophagaceae bacterium]|nr:cyclodeaminase/cyclohydrolase family protein [Chitinophagaceae bacterium]
VGLVPLHCLLDAGKYFLEKQRRSTGVSEAELIRIAVKSMGLDELAPFDPKKKIIEYQLQEQEGKRLIDMNLVAFANETASESPAPGGGSISAYMGALGAALGTMVANLSSHKKGWDERWQYFGDYAAKGQQIKDELLRLVDEDTASFNNIMDAFALPKSNDTEKTHRSEAIQAATLYATEVPLRTMKVCYSAFPLVAAMIAEGNPNSITDAAVGALCLRSAIYGAALNVQINASGLKDKEKAAQLSAEAEELLLQAKSEEEELLKLTRSKMGIA